MKEARMPLDTSAYLSDTGHLSTLEHGAYLLILMTLWRSKDGWIDGSDNYLARATRMTLGRWKRIAPTLRALLESRDGKISQKRMLKERRSDSNLDKKVSPSENQNLEDKSLKNKGAISKTAENPKIQDDPPILTSLQLEDSNQGKKTSKRAKGTVCPEDWKPRPLEIQYGVSRGLSMGIIQREAEQMRRWSQSNAHREVARKSNWDLTFRNWLDRIISRSGPVGPSGPRRAGGNGFATLLVEHQREQGQFNREEDDHGDFVGGTIIEAEPVSDRGGHRR